MSHQLLSKKQNLLGCFMFINLYKNLKYIAARAFDFLYKIILKYYAIAMLKKYKRPSSARRNIQQDEFSVSSRFWRHCFQKLDRNSLLPMTLFILSLKIFLVFSHSYLTSIYIAIVWTVAGWSGLDFGLILGNISSVSFSYKIYRWNYFARQTKL